MARTKKNNGKKIAGVEVKSPTSQTPTRAPAMVPTVRRIALTAIEPVYWVVIMTRTVKMAQLSWGKGRTWVRYKDRVPAKLIFIPCLTRTSRNTDPSGHCRFRADERRWFRTAAVLTAQKYTTRPSRNQTIKISRKAAKAQRKDRSGITPQ